MALSGIRFNDCYFSEPTPLAQWTPPRCAGLFVILTWDSNWAPKPYRPLHFGEFGNNLQQILRPTDFTGMAGAAGTELLYVSAIAMPFSTTAQRRAIRAELVHAYNPVGQAGEAHNQFFEPPPDPEPRRRIGFLP
jgi:hypothetical protein